MNFSEKVKAELLGVKFRFDDEKRACLSAYVRSGGSIISAGGMVGFETSSDEKTAAFLSKLACDLYGEAGEITSDEERRRKDKKTLRFITKNSVYALIDLRIVKPDGDGLAVKVNIDDEIAKDEMRAAYVRGAFLGSGSVTVPEEGKSSNTGYHLEFVFSNYQTATDFCEILSEAYFMPKLTARKESYVVYFKTIDEISDLLAFIGATKAVLTVSEIAVEKDMNNDMNRKINCEMSNMVKQMDASVKQIRAIDKIEETIGLKSLPEGLRQVAEARLKFKKNTLSEIADELGITKSCLNHRFRKIIEIAEDL